MLGDGSFLGRAHKRVSRGHMRGDSDDYDDVLLQVDRPVSIARPLVSPELKFYDTFLASTEPSEGNTTDPLGVISNYAHLGFSIAAPGQGDSQVNRDGTAILVRSLQIRGTFRAPPVPNCTRPPPGRSVFLAVVRDNATNGNVDPMTAFQVFTNNSGAKDQMLNLLRNMFYTSRFEVLRSETFYLNPKTIAVLDPLVPDQILVGGVDQCFEFFIPLEMIVNFNGTSTQKLDSVVDNALHVICFASETAYLSPLENWQRCYLTYQTRIRFQSLLP